MAAIFTRLRCHRLSAWQTGGVHLWFVREFEGANPKTRIEKHIGVGEKDVPEPLKIVIFRILQEGVNNAVKHADADCIKVSLHQEGGVLAFSIADDGKGFDPDALARQGDARTGLGLLSMRERAELSGGTFTVTAAVGQGTKVCAKWPAFKATDGDRGQAGRTSCGLDPAKLLILNQDVPIMESSEP